MDDDWVVTPMNSWMFLAESLNISLQGPRAPHLDLEAKPDKLKIVTSATVSKLITEGTKVQHRARLSSGLVIQGCAHPLVMSTVCY